MTTPRRRHPLLFLSAIILAGLLASPLPAQQRTTLKHGRADIEATWRTRIRSFLAKGVVPLIDLESSAWGDDVEGVASRAVPVMDEFGVALISLMGRKAAKDGRPGYRWSTYIHALVNAHPDRFILTTNAGSTRNWWRQKSGEPHHFIDQLEREVRGGDYHFIGEIEFRHYMSNAQCKKEKTHRDLDIPLNGPNGHRVFRLSAETGVPFSIHLEPEDAPLAALEEMLAAYPKAKVVVAHFGQIRHPERQRRFGPALVTRLLARYPNLHYDISTGEPGRRYACTGGFDTVIWQDGSFGRQRDKLKPAYKDILTRFSGRFVVGFDFGASNRKSASFLRGRIANVRLILRDLADAAKHDIGYRNAWKLLTGKDWR